MTFHKFTHVKSTIQQFSTYLQIYYHCSLILEHFINQKKTHTHYHLPTFCSAVLAFSSVQFGLSDVSDSLQPHESQHTQASCPSPTPRVYPNSCASSRWCHPAISSSVVPFFSCLQSLPASGSFPMSQLFMKWPKYWSFSLSISPSNENPELVSFRMDWLGLLAVQGT